MDSEFFLEVSIGRLLRLHHLDDESQSSLGRFSGRRAVAFFDRRADDVDLRTNRTAVRRRWPGDHVPLSRRLSSFRHFSSEKRLI